MKIAVAAIAKNEVYYLLEWVAWHRMMGVDHLIIAENNSTDGTDVLLRGLDEAGVVTYLPFPSPRGKPAQMDAYRHILSEYGDAYDWMGFLDLDEFLCPDPGVKLRDTLAGLAPNVGQMVMNWAIYGSSGHESAGHPTHPDPVVQRFTYRALPQVDANHHVKVFLRRGAGDFTLDAAQPHWAHLRDGFTSAWPDGRLARGVEGDLGKTTKVRWSGLRLNHYVIKSYQEFREIKMARGDAMTGLQRDLYLFRSHDRNEVLDPVSEANLAALQAEMAHLETLLSSTSAQGFSPPEMKFTGKTIHNIEEAGQCSHSGRLWLSGSGSTLHGTSVLATNVIHVDYGNGPQPAEGYMAFEKEKDSVGALRTGYSCFVLVLPPPPPDTTSVRLFAGSAPLEEIPIAAFVADQPVPAFP